jgi:hypothetical protein
MASVPKSVGVFVILTLWALGACATGSHENAQKPVLIRLKPDPNARNMLELFSDAKLEIRHGCVYLVPATGPGESLAVFPPRYELAFSGGQAVGVTDTSTGRTLRFGAISQFGGGDVKDLSADVVMGSIPAACGGPRVSIYF